MFVEGDVLGDVHSRRSFLPQSVVLVCHIVADHDQWDGLCVPLLPLGFINQGVRAASKDPQMRQVGLLPVPEFERCHGLIAVRHAVEEVGGRHASFSPQLLWETACLQHSACETCDRPVVALCHAVLLVHVGSRELVRDALRLKEVLHLASRVLRAAIRADPLDLLTSLCVDVTNNTLELIQQISLGTHGKDDSVRRSFVFEESKVLAAAE